MNTFRTIELEDGSEWACNREGEGCFFRKADGTWKQYAGTGQVGPFRTAASFSRHVREHYRDENGDQLPRMVRGSGRGFA